MPLKEDLLRVYSYGRGPYYAAIIAQPSYQAEYQRTLTDYNARTWHDPLGIIPKFPAQKFNQMRQSYQTKYGTTTSIPGFNDIIHFKVGTTITPPEMAAHNWATRRNLPSPLSPDQLSILKTKKVRFIRALAAITPTWMKYPGAIMTSLDNLEDALVTIAVIGRLAAKAAPRLAGRAVPALGWVLTGADVINLFNVMSWASFAANGTKRNLEHLTEKNPFHAKARASRAAKLKRIYPTLGESLELLQTTDSLFGVGVCFGGIVGMLQEMISTVVDVGHFVFFGRFFEDADPDRFFRSVADKWKPTLKQIAQTFARPSPYISKQDLYQQVNKIFGPDKDNTIAAAIAAWDWGKLRQGAGNSLQWAWTHLQRAVITASQISAMSLPDQHAFYFSLPDAIDLVAAEWVNTNMADAAQNIRDLQFRPPEPTEPWVLEWMNEQDPRWRLDIRWPGIDKPYATAEQIAYNYAPAIKDQLQAYCLRGTNDYQALLGAQQTVEVAEKMLKAASDDQTIRRGRSAYVDAAIEMARNVYLIPPDTPRIAIEQLASWIGWYERTYATAPSIHLIARQGDILGIKWMRSFPRRAFQQTFQLYPQWRQIQAQLTGDFVAD